MNFAPDMTTNTVALKGLVAEELKAIFDSLLHEAIRAERRAKDERLGDEHREAEYRLAKVVNRLAAQLGEYKQFWS